MASVCNDSNGRRRILFVDVDKRRRTVRLGKISKLAAEKIKLRLESLLSAKILNQPISQDDAAWLEANAKVRRKLEKVGLISAEKVSAPKTRQSLSEFLDDYVERNKEGKKPGTVSVWKQVVANLKELMPKGIMLDEVTVGHAKEFHSKIKQRMATSTVDKRIRFCRQFFTDAVDWELIESNPFSKVKTTAAGAVVNVHVPAELICDQVIPVCDPTWQLIVALCRFGGLRCPSEVLSLRWADVNWETGRLSITEPKVEHHEGRGVRSCPIFGELRPYLEDGWRLAPEGAEYVISNEEYRKAANSPEGWKNTNLRTQFSRILKRAGVPEWKRLFHSMRASRQTELEREFPLHVVCSWLGNSVRIAQKSYLLVTEDDFAKATAVPSPNAAHKAAQQAPRTERAATTQIEKALENQAKTPVSKGFERRGQDSNLRIGLTRSLH